MRSSIALMPLAALMAGCSAVLPPRPPDPPQYEWRTLDDRPAVGPAFAQTNQYCNGIAASAVNPVLTVGTALAADGAYKACMAKAGYIRQKIN